MKKVFTLLCALLMVFALVGCKKTNEPVVEEEPVVVETPTQEVVEEPVVEEPTAEEILLDLNVSEDEKRAYCDSLVEGMTKEEKEQYLLELAGPGAEILPYQLAYMDEYKDVVGVGLANPISDVNRLIITYTSTLVIVKDNLSPEDAMAFYDKYNITH